MPATSARARFAAARPARRGFLRAGLTGVAAVGAGVTLAAPPASAAPASPSAPASASRRPSTPGEALRELAAGNLRWRTFRERHPDETPTVRQTLTSGQHPFAVILGCVDSRVPPELVFDQGLGDLLTVRSAGEVLDEAVLGSVAYGVLELGIPLVVVLGHQSCGAVRAAVDADTSGGKLPAHIQYLADQIAPNIDRTKDGDSRVDSTIDANVRAVRARLAAEPDLAAKVTAGQLSVVGARYELSNQLVHRLA
ncbi:carbonic anhydrase [Streptomyces resistomycificus]|uniref:Carbonic anhydrase n=2 Tax=Streptomyces resistomycificus TaxID=67356 RepID=A0A0L8LWI1_9ACTN|nr:carbonic anhydrase [Streptomyces resistomycificus]KUN92652.1 carbonic anhydrase [Streptomyces resistomycificus]